jgi:hypothetical protein
MIQGWCLSPARINAQGACDMSPIRHFDHVGITVRDLDTVTAFFAGLGFETEGRTVLEGEFLDTVIGMPSAVTTGSRWR